MSTDAPDTGTEPTPETTDATADATPDTGTDVDALAAELEKWKAQARKHEDRAKANAAAAKELQQLREQTMTETERAIEAARSEARAQVLAEVGASRVDDAVRLALAGRPVDPDALLEGLDRGRFLGDDGTPDRDGIAAWVDRIAPKPDPQATTAVDLGQGTRPPAASVSGDPLLADLKRAIGI